MVWKRGLRHLSMVDWLHVFSGILNLEQSCYGLVIVLAVYVAILLARIRNKKGHRREVGVVSEMYLYPVKSCKGIPIASGECTSRGLRYDRCWIVMDGEGQFLTQKRQPEMACVAQELEIDKYGQVAVTLTAPNMPPLKLTNHFSDAVEKTPIKVYRMFGEGIDCGSEASEWFSKYLELPGCRVYYMTKYCQPRQLTTDSKYGHVAQQQDEVAFANFAPYLLTSEASLADLNSRLDKPLSIRNFRPNIVIRGPNAFEEDNWSNFAIGAAHFRKLKECGRCALTTLDPDTGEKLGEEPLKTLRSYRSDERYGTAPKFGLHATIDKGGAVFIGERVFVYDE